MPRSIDDHSSVGPVPFVFGRSFTTPTVVGRGSVTFGCVASSHRLGPSTARVIEWSVLVAALASIPGVYLHASKGSAHDWGVLLGWVIWVVFAVEVVAMTIASHDRRSWLRSHQFELFVTVTSFPLFLDLPGVRELIGVAPVLGTVKFLKALKILKLAKVFRLLHASSLVGWLVRLASALLALVVLGLVGAMATEKKVPTPAHGVARLGDEIARVFDTSGEIVTIALVVGAIGAVEWWAWRGRRTSAS